MKKTIFIIIFLMVLFGGGVSALEVDYPKIPGAPDLESFQFFTNYIKYIR